MNLRTKLIRLAYTKPELRAHVLPLLSKKADARLDKLVRMRSMYLPPSLSGVDPEIPKGTDLMIWTWDDAGIPRGIAFQGRAGKPLWHYRFRDDAQRQRRVDETVRDRLAWIDRKKKQQEARRNYRHDYVVGDILSASWGYNQTNVNFYEVTDVRGKQIIVREVGQKLKSRDTGADYVVPTPGKYTSETYRRTPSMGGSIKINRSIYASKWDGKPMYSTPFGYGH